jgi:hypothetical protein
VNHHGVVLSHLLALTAELDDDDAVAVSFADLITALQIAVPSYRGLQLTVASHGYPVVLTSFVALEETAIATSLRLPLPLLGPGFEAGGRVVFYAGTPGALVDLAADLGYALDTADPDGSSESDTAISLDTDLPPDIRAAGITGLRELSIINRATGMLIERGHLPADVHDALRRYAAAAQLSPHDFAVRLLEN